MLRRFILISLFCLGLCFGAQAGNWFKAVKNWVDSSDFKGIDTAYVFVPDEPFIVFTNAYLSNNWMRVGLAPEGQADLLRLSGNLNSIPSTTVSAGLYYHGWGLSYSRGFSDYDDTDFTYTFYGRSYGLEYRYHNSHSLHGMLDAEGDDVPAPSLRVEESMGRLRTTMFNAYYVFDSYRFSHNAAMAQTAIQRRSCGSWLAIGNYTYGSYTPSRVEELLNFERMSVSNINLGAGYAYNYVFSHEHCLLHGLLAPMLTVWHRNRIHQAQDTKSLDQNLSMDALAHINFVYNHGRYIAGLQNIFNINLMSANDELSLCMVDWSGRFFIGVRF